MLADITYDEWSIALEEIVDQLLWEAGLSEPPVDAFLVATRLGLVVTQDVAQAPRARMVRLPGSHHPQLSQATIVLGDEQRFERRQFAIAHEIGEFAACRVFDRLGVDPRQAPYGSREQIANSLAGRLLLPARWFRKQGLACDWDLLHLKQMFWTASHELIARRMLDMSVPVVLSVFDQGHLTWRRSNYGGSVDKLLDIERECWLRTHQFGESTCSESESGYSIRCWPVHEPDWPREILRTSITTWD